MVFGGQITFSIPQKFFSPAIFFSAVRNESRSPTYGLRPSALNPSWRRTSGCRHMTCYFGPRARFIKIYLRVCLTSYYLLTTYLKTTVKCARQGPRKMKTPPLPHTYSNIEGGGGGEGGGGTKNRCLVLSGLCWRYLHHGPLCPRFNP